MSAHRFGLGLLLGGMVVLIGILPAGFANPSSSASAVGARGQRPVTVNKPRPYNEQWALIVGINYDKNDPGDNGPGFKLKLDNAENDARAFRQLLIDHYGYKPDKTILLEGAKATKTTILDTLEKKICKNSEMKPDDSVLVFFSGHGDLRTTDAKEKDRGVIYPYDVSFFGHKPTDTSVIRLSAELRHLLDNCPSKHKLLVLDCCHSGEIFNTDGVRPRSELPDPAALRTQKLPCYQALASCRAREQSSDGQGTNSPFTAALLAGLKLLPSRPDFEGYFTSHELFSFVRYEVHNLPRSQNPDFRNLSAEEGQFLFFPKGDFQRYFDESTSADLLRAMVPGEYGNWWLDETPWLIPSLRRQILTNHKPDKRSFFSDVLSKKKLKESAEMARRKMAPEKDKNPLVAKRLEQFEALLEADGGTQLKAEMRKLVDDLKPGQDHLEATDLHLLAVLQHSLCDKVPTPEGSGKPHLAAEKTYELALARYEKEKEAAKQEKREYANQPLMALCYADCGHFYLQTQCDPQKAVDHFEKGRELFPTNPPPPFQVYVLCREADAQQRLGRWGEATDRINWAIWVARNRMDPNHPLTAHACNRLAWTKMEQWKFQEAIKAFDESNAILATRLNMSPGEMTANPVRAPSADRPVGVPAVDRDFEAGIMWLHNRHGLAMARRFQGEAEEAAQTYRDLFEDIRREFESIREVVGLAQRDNLGEVKQRLAERWGNTLERLGDCNLFADYRHCDLKEASDDYRRAIRVCSRLPRNTQDVIWAGLMFKQAMALAIPSGIQDLELALEHCRDAEAKAATLAGEQSTKIVFQRELAPAIVGLFQAEKAANPERLREALASLRKAVNKLRTELGQDVNRDQLEFLLFASRLLVSYGIETDRYLATQDTEILLSFCRRALMSRTYECQAYLRQYYDTVIEKKLKLQPKQVKDVLEAIWEATQGKSFLKEREAKAILAAYILNGEVYLLLDAPQRLGGVSKCFKLDRELYTLEAVQAAATDPVKWLTLPADVEKELRAMKVRANPPGSSEVTVALECWWQDPVHKLCLNTPGDVLFKEPPVCTFPFRLHGAVKGFDPPKSMPKTTTAKTIP